MTPHRRSLPTPARRRRPAGPRERWRRLRNAAIGRDKSEVPQRSADYLVAGAGPAGLTVARLLALRGRRVVIVDPGLKSGGRLELLAPASLDTVAALGLTNLLDDLAIARPCLGICRRWGVDEPEYEDFFRHVRRSGYVVDRARFDAALRASAVAAGAEFVRGRVADIEPDGGFVSRSTTGSRKPWSLLAR